MRSKMLILGSSGFLGLNLLILLSKVRELEVLGASRRLSRSAQLRVKSYEPESIGMLLDKVAPDVVLNCVGIVGHQMVEENLELARALNVSLPGTLGHLTRQRGIRLVHFSSDSVYSGVPGAAPFEESSETNPFSTYGRQKLESERAAQESNEEVLIARINFFGWSGNAKKGILDHFVSHALAGTRPVGYPNYTVSSAAASTVATVVQRAVEQNLAGVFNLGSNDGLTKLQFGGTVFSLLGLDPERIIPAKPSVWENQGVQERDLTMSSRLIQSKLEIPIPSQEEEIAKTLAQLPQFLDSVGAKSNDPRHVLARSSVV